MPRKKSAGEKPSGTRKTYDDAFKAKGRSWSVTRGAAAQ